MTRGVKRYLVTRLHPTAQAAKLGLATPWKLDLIFHSPNGDTPLWPLQLRIEPLVAATRGECHH